MTNVEMNVIAQSIDGSKSIQISRQVADVLLAMGGYRSSNGANLIATHYRKSLDDGSCLHLELTTGGATLHRDRFDPHQGFSSFLNHLIHDAPVQTIAGVAIATILFKQFLGKA